MSKFQIGDKVHYTNMNGVYIGVFKVTGTEERLGRFRCFLENDGNPENYSIREDQLKIADKHEALGKRKYL